MSSTIKIVSIVVLLLGCKNSDSLSSSEVLKENADSLVSKFQDEIAKVEAETDLYLYATDLKSQIEIEERILKDYVSAALFSETRWYAASRFLLLRQHASFKTPQDQESLNLAVIDSVYDSSICSNPFRCVTFVHHLSQITHLYPEKIKELLNSVQKIMPSRYLDPNILEYCKLQVLGVEALGEFFLARKNYRKEKSVPFLLNPELKRSIASKLLGAINGLRNLNKDIAGFGWEAHLNTLSSFLLLLDRFDEINANPWLSSIIEKLQKNSVSYPVALGSLAAFPEIESTAPSRHRWSEIFSKVYSSTRPTDPLVGRLVVNLNSRIEKVDQQNKVFLKTFDLPFELFSEEPKIADRHKIFTSLFYQSKKIETLGRKIIDLAELVDQNKNQKNIEDFTKAQLEMRQRAIVLFCYAMQFKKENGKSLSSTYMFPFGPQGVTPVDTSKTCFNDPSSIEISVEKFLTDEGLSRDWTQYFLQPSFSPKAIAVQAALIVTGGGTAHVLRKSALIAGEKFLSSAKIAEIMSRRANPAMLNLTSSAINNVTGSCISSETLKLAANQLSKEALNTLGPKTFKIITSTPTFLGDLYIDLFYFTIAMRGITYAISLGGVPPVDYEKTFSENFSETFIWGGLLFGVQRLLPTKYFRNPVANFVTASGVDGTLFVSVPILAKSLKNLEAAQISGKDISYSNALAEAWKTTTSEEVTNAFLLGLSLRVTQGALGYLGKPVQMKKEDQKKLIQIFYKEKKID